MKSLGQIAYEVFLATESTPQPTWICLTFAKKQQWERIGAAVADHIRSQ